MKNLFIFLFIALSFTFAQADSNGLISKSCKDSLADLGEVKKEMVSRIFTGPHQYEAKTIELKYFIPLSRDMTPRLTSSLDLLNQLRKGVPRRWEVPKKVDAKSTNREISAVVALALNHFLSISFNEELYPVIDAQFDYDIVGGETLNDDNVLVSYLIQIPAYIVGTVIQTSHNIKEFLTNGSNWQLQGKINLLGGQFHRCWIDSYDMKSKLLVKLSCDSEIGEEDAAEGIRNKAFYQQFYDILFNCSDELARSRLHLWLGQAFSFSKLFTFDKKTEEIHCFKEDKIELTDCKIDLF